MSGRLLLLLPLALSASCAGRYQPLNDFEPVPAISVVAAPAPLASPLYAAELAEHGQYLVDLLGCGACHTDGALIGRPDSGRQMAGSRIGLAHSNPLTVRNPGVVFPTNLTPDVDTGIGALPDELLTRAIRSGLNRHGAQGLRVMPVTAYSRLTDADVTAIVAYLRSLPPVSHRVPDPVPEGVATTELFVHFGVYRSRAQ